LQLIVLTSLLLHFGKTLFIPIVFSLLISFFLYPICKWMENKVINRWIAIVISILGVTLLVGAILYLLFAQFAEFLQEWQSVIIKLTITIHQLSIFILQRFDMSLEKQNKIIKIKLHNSGSQTFSIIRNTAYSSYDSVFFVLIIPVFSALILLHRRLLSNYLYELSFPKKIFMKFWLKSFMNITILSKACC